jgi:xanthine/uracil permease
LWLFIIYGVVFESLYIKFLTYWQSYKRTPASTISVTLFVINLWGLGEAFKNNIMYAIPIILGTFVGTYLQMTLEHRKSEREKARGHGASTEQREIQI